MNVSRGQCLFSLSRNTRAPACRGSAGVRIFAAVPRPLRGDEHRMAFIADSWISSRGRRAVVIAAFAVAGGIAGVGALVYVTGGTAFAWVHAMYLPVIFAAAVFMVPGAIVSALAGGVVLGPFMPLHVLTGTPQDPANWIVRTAFFLAVGTFCGLLFTIVNRQLVRLKRTHEELVTAHKDLKETQLQLIQAAKLESVGRLAAGIAHEVKNPLATIQLGIDYVSGKIGGDDDTAEVVADMDSAVKRADAVIRGLLDFSRSEKLDLAPMDLNAVIEDSLLLVKHELGRKNISVDKHLDGALPRIAVDHSKMQQVFVNLFINAIHAMSGGGTLTVKTFVTSRGKEDAGKSAVIAEIDDSGTGIPEDKLQSVFDPFFTTKPAGQGTGLGLSVTRKILELHHAAIDIRNRKEGGVSVVIAFAPCKGGS